VTSRNDFQRRTDVLSTGNVGRLPGVESREMRARSGAGDVTRLAAEVGADPVMTHRARGMMAR